VLAVMQCVEIGDAIDAERLAVDHELPMSDLQRRVDDPWVSAGPMVAAVATSAESDSGNR
jgi:hypothetical protein